MSFTWNEWLIVGVITLIILTIGFPIRINLKLFRVDIDYGLSPVIGVIILVASSAFPLGTVWDGIRGTSSILPVCE